MDKETSSLETTPLDVVPLANRPAVQRALQATFGSLAVDAIEPLTSGASGARVFRLDVPGARRLLRVETNRGGAHDPVRQFACMRIASDAGVAPRVHYANGDDGVAITDFIRASTTEGGNGRDVRLSSLARTVAVLHEAPLFPSFMSFFDAMDFLVGNLETSGVLPESIGARLAARYGPLRRRIRDRTPSSYPATMISIRRMCSSRATGPGSSIGSSHSPRTASWTSQRS